MAAASNSKAKGSSWPTKEKKRQLEMENVMEVGESFRFLRRLSMNPKTTVDEMKEGDWRKEEGINEKDWVNEAGLDEKEWKEEEWKDEKDWMKEEEETGEKKEPDGALGRSGEHGAGKDAATSPDGQMEEVPVEEHPADRTADAVAAQLRSHLAKAHEQQDLARWQGYQEGVDWALDSVQSINEEEKEEAHGWKGKGQHRGKGRGKNQKGHGSGGKGKHAHKGKGKGWHHANDGNRPHWSKQKWRQEPLPQGKTGRKGEGKGKFDQRGGEYCIGGYRAVSGFFSWVQVATIVNHLKS